MVRARNRDFAASLRRARRFHRGRIADAAYARDRDRLSARASRIEPTRSLARTRRRRGHDRPRARSRAHRPRSRARRLATHTRDAPRDRPPRARPRAPRRQARPLGRSRSTRHRPPAPLGSRGPRLASRARAGHRAPRAHRGLLAERQGVARPLGARLDARRFNSAPARSRRELPRRCLPATGRGAPRRPARRARWRDALRRRRSRRIGETQTDGGHR